MVMSINIENFKEVLKKATLNYKIDTVQINYDEKDNTIWSRMADVAYNGMTIIKIENNVFKGIDEDLQLNFATPKTDVKPYLDLFEEEEVSIKIDETFAVMNGQVKIHFDDPSTIGAITGRKMEAIDDYFVEFPVNEEFVSNFEKIKKIGNRFGKVYMSVDDNNLFLETTDMSNHYSNGVKYKICDVNFHDITLCFDYQFFINMMSVINDKFFDFDMKLCYMEKPRTGILKISNGDETYYLKSKQDI